MGSPAESLQCPVPSISVRAFAEVLNRSLSATGPSDNHSVESLEKKLRSEEWTRDISDCLGWNNGCDKEGDRISRGEAGKYLHGRYASSKKQPWTPWESTLVSSFNRFFFQNRNDWLWDAARPLRKDPMTIRGTSDGDTFDVALIEEGCESLEVKLRLSSVDTPESYSRSSKFDKDVKKVLIRLQESLQLSPEETAALRPLVEKRVQYTGKLSALVSEDFAGWVQKQKSERFLLGASYLFGESRYFKEEEKGVLESNDYFLRGLGLVLTSDWGLVGQYFQERLPQLMATQGKELYDKFMREYSEEYARRVPGRYPNREKIASIFGPDRVPNPASIFRASRGKEWARRWNQTTGPLGLSGDWGLALVYAGLGFFAPDYANQYRESYKAVQDAARRERRGQFQDPVFALQDASLPPVDYKNSNF